MILNQDQQSCLVGLMDHEIEHNLCPTVPKHQSFNNMHLVHANKEEIKILVDQVLMQAYTIFRTMFRVQACWFNILKSDSPYEISYHKHNCDAVCVYYLKNCTNNGTVLLFNGEERHLACLDNTIQFMSGDLMHSIPKFKGLDRYSVAFDLGLK